ncbi:hypothetical protein NDU88_005572 [Pleurodeles waltl]|uniref:Uncharacterized protein n=1 Tax=Pleurodeles waltl TaxID=8319 RepID=A0AAV7RLW5_PLEWA|nr:hypothetical protein NDU88_005572 [Pleurodeles waltl]
MKTGVDGLRLGGRVGEGVLFPQQLQIQRTHPVRGAPLKFSCGLVGGSGKASCSPSNSRYREHVPRWARL